MPADDAAPPSMARSFMNYFSKRTNTNNKSGERRPSLESQSPMLSDGSGVGSKASGSETDSKKKSTWKSIKHALGLSSKKKSKPGKPTGTILYEYIYNQ